MPDSRHPLANATAPFLISNDDDTDNWRTAPGLVAEVMLSGAE